MFTILVFGKLSFSCIRFELLLLDHSKDNSSDVFSLSLRLRIDSSYMQFSRYIVFGKLSFSCIRFELLLLDHSKDNSSDVFSLSLRLRIDSSYMQFSRYI